MNEADLISFEDISTRIITPPPTHKESKKDERAEGACDLIIFFEDEQASNRMTPPPATDKESRPPDEAAAKDEELEEETGDLISFEDVSTRISTPPPATDKEESKPSDETAERDSEVNSNDLLLEIVQEGVAEVELEKKPYTARFDSLGLELQTFINNMKEFFTKKLNYQRKELPLSLTTINKNVQRILGFIGYCERSGAEFTVPKFQDLELIEEYVEYLQVSRSVTASTAVNHLVALTYPIKFINQRNAPSYVGVESLLSVRELMRYLTKEDSRQKHLFQGSLKDESKWEDWSSIVAAVKRFEGSDGYGPSLVEKSRFMHDLLLLHMFTVLPPGRSAEYRSLRFLKKDQVLEAEGNVMFLNHKQEYEMNLRSYKTGKFYGCIPVKVPPGSILERSIRNYLAAGRPNLTKGSATDCLFLTKRGTMFSEPAFSMYLKRLFKKVCGKALGVCALRSSFVTFAYGANVEPAVKESIAFNMRHTEREAQRTYDKRSKRKRLEAGIEFARCAYVQLDDVMESQSGSFQPGDFVTITTEDGDGPKVGRVYAKSGTRYFLLSYTASKGGREIHLSENFGKLETDGSKLTRLQVDRRIALDTYRVKGRRLIT